MRGQSCCLFSVSTPPCPAWPSSAGWFLRCAGWGQPSLWLAGSETTFQTQRVAMRRPLSYTDCQILPWLQHLGTSRCVAGIDSSGHSSSKGQPEERKVWKKMARKHRIYKMEKFSQLLFNIWLKLGNPNPTLFLLFSPALSAG